MNNYSDERYERQQEASGADYALRGRQDYDKYEQEYREEGYYEPRDHYQDERYENEARRPRRHQAVTTRQSYPPRPGSFVQLFQQMLNDFSQLFRAWFSSKPLNAFRFDLSLLTWIGIFFCNLLFVALYRGFVFPIITEATQTPLQSFFLSFAYGLLNQLILLFLLFVFLTGLAYALKVEKFQPLTLLKAVATAAFPATLLIILAFILTFVWQPGAIALMQVSSFLFLYGLIEGFRMKFNVHSQLYWVLLPLLLLIQAARF